MNTICNMVELDRFMGNLFTWNNQSHGMRRISSKLHKLLVNDCWTRNFPNSKSNLISPSILNHCLSIVRNGRESCLWRSSFKNLNLWAEHELFLPIIDRVWKEEVKGSPIFRLLTKLKRLNKELIS